jgi:hypothetical protein
MELEDGMAVIAAALTAPYKRPVCKYEASLTIQELGGKFEACATFTESHGQVEVLSIALNGVDVDFDCLTLGNQELVYDACNEALS